MNTYLGQKGYTIPKHELSVQQQIKIRSDLTVKPFTMGAPINDAKSFPCYRESVAKFYVPHYYGVEHFGRPAQYKISEGDDISIPFNGMLRDYQVPVIDTFVQHCLTSGYGGGLLELYCAWGKTAGACKLISIFGKKTIVIVHKEFLMNQWIERIQQFLPSARIGKIQGPIIDIENKDIVIAMLQSLSMKDYPASTFDSFGFTIIDEVHHISSEVFSQSLFKLVTKYTLGLSATMNRKDGTTPVFKMFLGNVICKSKRANDREVVVRAIEYCTNDDEFNDVILDYRGKVQYSSMICKLCNYNRRSEFILRVLTDMLIENPNQQCMILAHNKNVLKYLHDAIAHRNIASVGYYLGGMKEAALKETETKQVVIATYAMAAEALDIKTLTTLLMVTPKTDIEQSIGRILRDKHSNPIVVDFVDGHSLFKNQWRKRRSYYKKENYKVLYIRSTQYNPDTSTWSVVIQPTNSVHCNKTSVCNDIDDDDVDVDADADTDADEATNNSPEEICFLKLKK